MICNIYMYCSTKNTIDFSHEHFGCFLFCFFMFHLQFQNGESHVMFDSAWHVASVCGYWKFYSFTPSPPTLAIPVPFMLRSASLSQRPAVCPVRAALSMQTQTGKRFVFHRPPSCSQHRGWADLCLARHKKFENSQTTQTSTLPGS